MFNMLRFFHFGGQAHFGNFLARSGSGRARPGTQGADLHGAVNKKQVTLGLCILRQLSTPRAKDWPAAPDHREGVRVPGKEVRGMSKLSRARSGTQAADLYGAINKKCFTLRPSQRFPRSRARLREVALGNRI